MPFDLLFLTQAEYEEAPLLEMAALKVIYVSKTVAFSTLGLAREAGETTASTPRE